MRISILLVLLLLVAQGVFAKALHKEDFAAGFELALKVGSGLHRLSLPENIYAQAVDPALTDIRVFNGLGEPVPQMLRHDRKKVKSDHPRLELPFSPFYEKVPSGAVLYQSSARLMTGGEGVAKGVSGITGTAKVENEKVRRRKGYLIETDRVKEEPYRLELGIGNEEDFLLTVTVEESDDLDRWDFVARESLARLRYRGYLIEKGAEGLIYQKSKYLRISWPVDESDIQIDSVTAVSAASVAQLPQKWTRVTGQMEPRGTNHDILHLNFINPGVLPVEKVMIIFPEENSLFQAKLRSRRDEKVAWTERGKATFYRLQVDGTVLNHDTIYVPVTSDRFWQLEIQTKGEAVSAALPDLRMGWSSHDLYFVAQGPGPYVLAVGNGRMPEEGHQESAALGVLVQEAEKKIATIPQATVRSEIILGGPTKRDALPPPLPWKKWLLWAILVGGVLLIGRMAYTLHRQMKATS